MPINLIPTKVIIPKRMPGAVRRSHLLDFLYENLERKLLLITAPPGYGKTTLLIDFATEVDLPVCWFTLDEGDRDLNTFVSHLVASIRQQFPKFGERTMSLSESGTLAARAAASALVNDMIDDVPEYFVLILDDWHLIGEETTIRELLDQLLHYLPEHVHLVIAGRTLPRGSLIRLTAEGAVAGIGPNNLRFTPAEVRALLASKYGIEVTENQATHLVEESEGWITGILLTSQAIWGGLLAGLMHTAGAPGALYDYLAGEVFDRLSPPLRRFLLESAVPKQFTAALCDELRGVAGSEAWIDQVEARSLFLTRVVADGETWFRYHHLFREFLLARFKRDDPAGLARLHLRCGELLEVRQQIEEVVEHYLDAGAPARAARVMDEMASGLFIAGRLQTLLRWAELLPADLHTDAPELLLFQGQALIDRGQPAQALSVLDEAEAGFRMRDDVVGQVRATLPHGWAQYARGRLRDALSIGQSVLNRLAELNVDDPLLRAQALRLVGASYTGIGEWQAAESFLTESLSLYRHSDHNERRVFNLGRVLQDLANALRAQGRLEEAATLQAEALSLWRQVNNPALLAASLNNAGYDRHLAGDYEGALSLYTEALDQAEEADDKRTHAYLLEGIAAAERDRGEFQRAIEVYADAFNMANEIGDLSLAAWVLDGLGHAHRLADNLDRAVSLFEQARRLADRESNLSQVTLATASDGIARVEQGMPAGGIAELERAVRDLQASDSHTDLGRVLFWLARAYHACDQLTQAKDTLLQAVRLGNRMGCRPFSLAEGRRALTFLAWGAAQLSAEPRLQTWLEAVRASATLEPVTAPPVEAGPRIEVRGFGSGQVVRDGHVLTIPEWGGSAIARELLFFLLDKSPVRKEEIGATFWPDLSLAKMTNAFHATKYRARRALGVEFVVYSGDCYLIKPEVHVGYDVAEFERLLDSARHRAVDDAERPVELQQAVNLYTGEFLSEMYSEWVVERRRVLHARYFDTLGQLTDHLARSGQHKRALELCHRGIEQDYFREELHRGVMHSLAALGRAAEALMHYRELERRLRDELGARPAPETQELAERIRSQ
ncbi:MAG TPA: tetratricopeptide repeat protein [Anaerolineae bacterium]